MLKFSKLEMRYFDLKLIRPRVTRESHAAFIGAYINDL